MMSIRSAALGDVAALQQLFLQLGYQTEPGPLSAHLAQGDSHRRILVAESGGVLNGVLVMNFIVPVHEAGTWAVISALVIDEAYRGAGTGAQLLAAAEQIARARRCTQVELSSSERRTRAHAFYEHNGYREVRKRFVKRLAA